MCTYNANIRIKFVISKRKAMAYPIKAYELETIFKFGKYKGKSLAEVAAINVHYILWCIKNVENFYIGTDTINDIYSIVKIAIPNDIHLILQQKAFQLENEDMEEDHDEYNNSFYERKSCNENPWVDVFGEGEEAETAYWNTD
jgi:hypothetical protein